MKGRLVGLTGLAGSGKSTASAELQRLGWQNVKMAGPLKDMMRVIGLTEDHIEGLLKEVPCGLLGGKTPRYAMQTIGTEWGRDIIGPDFWVGISENRVKEKLNQGIDVVVDDVRFQNEADMIRRNGGVVVAINGRGGIAGSHQSEAGVESDFNIMNDRSIIEFKNNVVYILHRKDD